ncbi:MAG: hypothetical protein K8T90_22665, partial [Planctomycetes bacterium]|nr:hypothetical protein [Planctomycetota bacterium]
MTRTLICGPAGSGKTRRVMDEVLPMLGPGPAGASDAAVRPLAAEAPMRRFLVLVPTYSQAEHLKRRFLRQAGLNGLLDRGVVTFEQLAERRTGIRLATLAPAAVRDGLLAAAFEEDAAREAGAGADGDADGDADSEGGVGANVFANVARFPGFRRAALRFLDEVKAIEPDPDVDVVAAAADRLATI